MQINLLPHQEEFLFNSKEKYVLLCGGIGSGKSWAGSHYVIKKCIEDGKGLGLITANTYKQLTNSTLACLFRELDLMEIPYSYVQNKGKLKIMDSELLCLSLESYDYIRGLEIGYFWADEVRDTREEAFLVLLGRLRDKRTKQLEGRLTTSPSGFNWIYDYWAGEKKTKDFKIVNADSRDNYHLPKGYIESIMGSYDPMIIDQEIKGNFVNTASGKCYYGFDRTKHCKNESQMLGMGVRMETPKKCGCDFNVDPITSCMGYYENDIIYVRHEIYKRHANTYWLADEIKSRWGEIDVFPDATGKARKSSATKTDHEILKDNGMTVHYNPNPHVKDRYNLINGLFYHNRLFVHPDCKMLIKDLEQLTYDTKDGMLSHMSDALGYMGWGLAKRERPKSRSIAL